jgi:hypothetical protein
MNDMDCAQDLDLTQIPPTLLRDSLISELVADFRSSNDVQQPFLELLTSDSVLQVIIKVKQFDGDGLVNSEVQAETVKCWKWVGGMWKQVNCV